MKAITWSSITLLVLGGVAASFGGCGGDASSGSGGGQAGAGGSQTGPGSGGSTQTASGGSTATSSGGSSANGGGGTAGGGTGGAGVGGSSGTAGGGTGGGCGVATCPSQQPADGDPCTMCEAGLDCIYATCASSQGAHEAKCHQGHWAVQPTPCTFACGSTMCMAGEVCVHQPVGPTEQESCKANPCQGQQLDCSCAASVCLGNMCMGTTPPNDIECSPLP